MALIHADPVTQAGKPVEAVISPVTPTAAVLPGKTFYSREMTFLSPER